MLRIVIDKAQSDGDFVKIIDADTVLMSVNIDELPDRDGNEIFEIGLTNDEFGSSPALWQIKDLTTWDGPTQESKDEIVTSEIGK